MSKAYFVPQKHIMLAELVSKQAIFLLILIIW